MNSKVHLDPKSKITVRTNEANWAVAVQCETQVCRSLSLNSTAGILWSSSHPMCVHFFCYRCSDIKCFPHSHNLRFFFLFFLVLPCLTFPSVCSSYLKYAALLPRDSSVRVCDWCIHHLFYVNALTCELAKLGLICRVYNQLCVTA